MIDRMVAVVDCGRSFNDDIVLQQIEGGILWGMAAALGATTQISGGLADARNFDMRSACRSLANTPEIVVQLIRSDEASGGVGEIAVPPVAPAIANALFAATGVPPSPPAAAPHDTATCKPSVGPGAAPDRCADHQPGHARRA